MSALQQCDACGIRPSDDDHFLSASHLLNLTNLATSVLSSSSQIRAALSATSNQAKSLLSKLESLKPSVEQDRQLLFHWTGFHGHEGLNLRHGACMLTPSPSGGTRPDSLHRERCNLLYVSGGGAYAALPPMNLPAACTISIVVKVHSFPANSQLVRLGRSLTDKTDAVILEVSELGFGFAAYHEAYEEEKILTKADCVKQGQWQHVVAQIEHSGRMRLWVDGALVATGHGFPLSIVTGMREYNMIGLHCHAAFKDVRIWSVPLDPKEIEEVEVAIVQTYHD